MPEISVIVPVYNVEAYLNNTLGSILGQSFTNFELLLIDDGSTDASLSICQKYAAMDSRVTVYHQTNQGIAITRNFGLEHAKGQFIIFVDSDDYLHQEMLEQLYTLAQAKAADVAICDFKRTRTMQESLNSPVKGEAYEFSQLEGLKNFLCPGRVNFDVSVWNKLFRKQCLEGISFDVSLSMNEDKYFVSQALCKANKIVYTSKSLYFYLVRPGSITNSSNAKTWLQCVRVGQRVYEDICAQYPELEPYARYQLIIMHYYIFNLLFLLKECDEEAALELKYSLARLPLRDLEGFFSLKQKISIFFIKNLPFGVYKGTIPRLWRIYEALFK